MTGALAYLRASLKLQWRRWRDRRTRARLRRIGARGGCIIAASTWAFPNPTHTFVQQELLGLRALAGRHGLALCIAHGVRRPSTGLARRFVPLLDGMFRVESATAIHRADRSALEREFPGRVDAVLRQVAAATGRDVAALRDDPAVMRACTFTRLCQIAGARYLQTWFCYEESFHALFAAAVLGVPRGLSCHVDHVLADHPLKLVPLHLATADLVTAISEAARLELLAVGGPSAAARIVVKRIGVDATALRPLRAAPRPGCGLLLSISRIEPKKGLSVLVEAVARLRARGRDVRAAIVGGVDAGRADSAACADDLRRRIAAAGLDEVISLPGACSNDALAARFAIADVFVAPYVPRPDGDKDGIPTSLVEAMASGVPIVASAVGAVDEAVRDGREALLVPPGDVAALAAAIERLLDDPALGQRLATAAAARFDADFDAARVDAPLHERVAGLLAGGRARAQPT